VSRERALAAASARTAGSGLRVVYGRVRHARSEGSQALLAELAASARPGRDGPSNPGNVLTPNEMRLQLKLTTYHPNAVASIVPLSVANDCDRGEFLLDGTFSPAI
jgi:hypothetical protein